LGVEENCAEIFGDSGVVFDEAFGEVAVVGEASGDVVGADAGEGSVEERDCVRVQVDGDVGGEEDFAGVSDQAEAGDVGQGMDGGAVVGRWSLVVSRWSLVVGLGGCPHMVRSDYDIRDHFGGFFV